MTSGDRIDTGTGETRRRLTEAEAHAGGLPARFTAKEWRHMASAVEDYTDRLFRQRARAAGVA